MFFKKSRQIEELERQLDLLNQELNRYYGKKETETIYIDKCHELKMEMEILKFKLNQKQDLSEVIRRVRKEYLYTLDKDLHKQYIELVELYNRIGE